MTSDEARQFAAELIASANVADGHAAEVAAENNAKKLVYRTYQVSLSVVAPARLTDADVAGIIDLHDWHAGTDFRHGILIDDVYHIPEHVPTAVNNERALYMDGLDLIEPRAIPRAYKRAAEDWVNYCHEQDGVLKLAQLLYLLDARMLSGFTPDDLETIERLEFEENNRLVLRNGGAQ
jgi:hypothetical protein